LATLFISVKEPPIAILDESGLELRLDLFIKLDLVSVREWIEGRPVILTLRSKAHGGRFEGSESEREEKIRELLELRPKWFDLEWDMREEFLEEVREKYRETQVILSFHDFEKTPRDLESVLQRMRRQGAYHYKIAAMALSTNDALRMCLFGKRHPDVSVICMGERGAFGRVLGPVMGNRVNYARGQEEVAPGQLSVEELKKIYGYSKLNSETRVYGLVGEEVERSCGHIHHNRVFRERAVNAVYVKMAVRKEELREFFVLVREMGVEGLSVTMPFKEAVIPFLDEVGEKPRKMGAVNTIVRREGRLVGMNTDGDGALDPLEKWGRVAGKRVVILGAGGAARAIAFEAHTRGAEVWVLGRTMERAKEVGEAVGCRAGHLSEIPTDYDILINATPARMPIEKELMVPGRVVMDIVSSPKETEFLLAAKERGCQVVYGEEMFVAQAKAQTALWLD
jgi:3-dehydroquinate dehydratase/shikimate dehydrogenase